MCDSEQLSSSVVNNTQENKSTSNLINLWTNDDNKWILISFCEYNGNILQIKASMYNLVH